MNRLLPLFVIAACGTSSHSTTISEIQGPFTGETCALATPRRTPVKDLRFEQWLGRVGDRSWVLGERDHHHVLVTLGNDGALAITPLPGESGDKFTAIVDGTHLWFDREVRDPDHEELFDIELSEARPTIPKPQTLVGKTLGGTNAFGMNGKLLLAYSFARFAGGPGFQLLDRQKHAPIATLQYPMFGIDDPPIRCVTACFAVTRPDQPGRSLAAQVFPPDGTQTTAPLTEDEQVVDVKLVPLGERTLVVWDGFARNGLFARMVDANGHAAGDEFTLHPGHALNVEIAPGPRTALAYRDARGWALAKLAQDSHGLEAEQRIGFPQASFVTVAQTTDGTLVMAFTSGISVDTLVPPTTASAVFLPATGTAAAPIDMMFGERRFSWVPFPLVAPGFAGALVIEQGYSASNGKLVMLRQPCGK